MRLRQSHPGILRREDCDISRRRLLLFAMAAIAVLLTSGVFLFWPQTAITPENAAKIQVGMTLAEVESLLGGLERYESRRQLCVDRTQNIECTIEDGALVAPGLPDEAREMAWWTTNRITVQIGVGSDRRGIYRHYLRVRRVEGNPLAHLRRWLDL